MSDSMSGPHTYVGMFVHSRNESRSGVAGSHSAGSSRGVVVAWLVDCVVLFTGAENSESQSVAPTLTKKRSNHIGAKLAYRRAAKSPRIVVFRKGTYTSVR